MVTIDIAGTLTYVVHQRMNQFRALVQRYHADPDYRRQVEADPMAAFREQGMELPSDIAVRVLANTDDTHYMIMPPDPNMGMSDELLNSVAGGGATVGSATSVGCATTTSCPVSSLVSTIGTAGTVGTASP